MSDEQDQWAAREKLEKLAWPLQTALGRRLRLYGDIQFAAVGLSLDLSMRSESAGSVIAAAGIPLVGWESAVDLESFKPPSRHPKPRLHTPPLCPPYWDVNSEGSVERMYGYGDDADSSHSYRFAADGSLVSTEADAATKVRDAGARTPITVDEALAVMAALLRDFAPLAPVLQGNLSAKMAEELSEFENLGLRLARALEQSSAGAHLGISEPLALVCRQFVEDARELRLSVKKQAKPKKARMLSMGPLLVAFNLLFGVPPLRRYRLNDDAKQVADGAFIRFSTAFFEAVGCPCANNTVNSALRAWRAAQRTAKCA